MKNRISRFAHDLRTAMVVAVASVAITTAFADTEVSAEFTQSLADDIAKLDAYKASLTPDQCKVDFDLLAVAHVGQNSSSTNKLPSAIAAAALSASNGSDGEVTIPMVECKIAVTNGLASVVDMVKARPGTTVLYVSERFNLNSAVELAA